MDAANDTHESHTAPEFPVVGIGASAGGLNAAKALLAATPADTGMAFVLVFHLDPKHKSEVAALLRGSTQMPVAQVEGRIRLEPNHVYVIPPNHGLALEDGVLALTKLKRNAGRPTVIDHFFRSLAEYAGDRAIGVVLSGMGSEGSQGLKTIKEAGGLTVVQDESEAEYGSMPHSAIATGLIDFVLPVAKIPAKLLEVKDSAVNFALTANKGATGATDEDLLQKIFVQLRTRVGHDFSCYKRNTVLRRIARRMQVHQLPDLGAYLELLRSTPAEAETLFRELLISVTNFFRDPQAMEALAQEIGPKLCQRLEGRPLRVWVPGCATGEEAYSLAMLIGETCDGLAAPPRVQIFASDVDERALEIARRGLYPDAIGADVSEERLKRFFDREGEGYAVKGFLREMILFTRHDLLQDPPFSKLDLISCRNLLIYLNADIQARIFRLFHFALRPHGYLFLGSSESLGEAQKLYTELDRKSKLYQSRRVPVAEIPFPLLPKTPWAGPEPRDQSAPPKRFEEIARDELLSRFAPPCVIVDENFDVAYISGRVGRYLEPGTGAANYNILDMAREGLRVELRSALYGVFHGGDGVRSKAVRMRAGGKDEMVGLTVRPLAEADGHALVVFEPLDTAATPAEPVRVDDDSDRAIAQLETELTNTRESLQTSIEELETSNEELRASNEELRSVNEELQSTTEELETGKEELQSTNEELLAVNQELRGKNDELARSYADLDNFIASADIGTLFLDTKLRVRRYTPRVIDVFNLIPGDIGRPLAHVTGNLVSSDLVAAAERVLRDLAPLKQELTATSGSVYEVRLRPYRDLENKIGGVVLTFVDITLIRRAEAALRRNEAQLALAVEMDDLGHWELDLDTREFETSPTCRRNFGRDPGAPFTFDDLRASIHPDDRERHTQALAAAVNERAPFALEYRVVVPAGGSRLVAVHGRFDTIGGHQRLVGVSRDVTERRRLETVLQESARRKAYLLDLSDALRPLAAPGAIAVAACQVLVDALDTSRARYVLVEGDAAAATGEVCGEHVKAGPRPRRRFALAAYGEAVLELLRAGKTVVLADVDHDSRLTAAERDRFQREHSQAAVLVPLVKEGRLHALLAVQDLAPRAWSEVDVSLAEEAAERVWAAVAQAIAARAVAHSEEKYRALFDTMDEGFCVIEQYDAAAGEREYRWVEGNTAFVAQTRLSDPLGKSIRAHFPEHATEVFASFDRVLATGETAHSVNHVSSQGRTYDQHMFRLGSTGSRRLAVLSRDITRRMSVERRQAFMLKLSDALRPLADPVEIQLAAMRVLGAGLQVQRAQYWEPDASGEFVASRGGYADGIAPVTERVRLADFGAVVEQGLTAGRTLAVADVGTDPHFDAAERAVYAALDIRAWIDVPLIKGDRLVAVLGVHSQTPRQWTAAEVALVEETAQRTWAAMVQARAERLLAQGEERLQLALDAAATGSFVWYPQEDRGEPDARMLELFGQPPDTQLNLASALSTFIHPEDRERYAAAVAAACDPAGDGLLDAEVRVLQPDGTCTWVVVRAKVDFAGDPPRAVRMPGTARDITLRRRQEATLVFVASVADDLERLVNIEVTLDGLMAKIGAYFQASVCAVSEVDAAAQAVTIEHAWARAGVPQPRGLHPIGDAADTVPQWAYCADGLRVVADVSADPQCDAGSLQAAAVAAFVSVPIRRRDGRKFILSVLNDAPRQWRNDEIMLLRELASRIWLRLGRARAEAVLAQSEARYRNLFNSIDEGFCIIEMLHDDAGKPVDYRFLEVNPAFQRHTGLSDAQGKTIGELVPSLEQDWFDLYGEVAASGESRHFEHCAEGMARTFQVYAFRIGEPGQYKVAVVFSDVTARRREERVVAQLAGIVDSTDDAIISKDLVGVITTWNKSAERIFGYTAAEAIGRPITDLIIPADRLDEEADILRRIAKGETIDHFETVRRCKQGWNVRVSVTISPLVVNGRVVGASKIARDVGERKRAEEHRELLIHELNHRVKNTLATVQALAMQTFSSAASRRDLGTFDARLVALSAAHDVLTRESWRGAAIDEIVQDALAAWSRATDERISLEGPALRLRPTAALAIAMSLHELATNSTKYGALSNKHGAVAVHWAVSGGAKPVFSFEWRESGGPRVHEPQRRGFGTRLIEYGLAQDIGGKVTLTFNPSGLDCRAETALAEVDEQPPSP